MPDLHAAIRERLDTYVDASCDYSGHDCHVTGHDKMKAAILAVLEPHEPVHYDGRVEYEWRDEPAYDASGKRLGKVRVRGDALPPDWCEVCADVTPCPPVRIIAEKLGIEVGTDG